MKHYPRKHSFRGRQYSIYWRKPRKTKDETKRAKKHDIDVMGKAEPPYENHPRLTIAPRKYHIDDWDFAGSILHEAIHASLWDLEEAAVEEMERDIVALFRKMGAEIKFPI